MNKRLSVARPQGLELKGKLTVLQDQSFSLLCVNLFLWQVDDGNIGALHGEHDGCRSTNPAVASRDHSFLIQELAGSLVELVAALAFLLQSDGVLAHLGLDTDCLAFIPLGVDVVGVGAGHFAQVGRRIGVGLGLDKMRKVS